MGSTLGALPVARARVRRGRAVFDARALGRADDGRARGVSLGMIVARTVRATAFAHAVAGRLAANGLTARRGFAAIRLAIGVRAAGQRSRQTAAATGRALKASASDAAQVLEMDRTRSGLWSIAALANAVTGRVAAHAINAVVARTLRGRTAVLSVHTQASAAHLSLLARAHARAGGGAHATLCAAVGFATTLRARDVRQANPRLAVAALSATRRNERAWRTSRSGRAGCTGHTGCTELAGHTGCTRCTRCTELTRYTGHTGRTATRRNGSAIRRAGQRIDAHTRATSERQTCAGERPDRR